MRGYETPKDTVLDWYPVYGVYCFSWLCATGMLLLKKTLNSNEICIQGELPPDQTQKHSKAIKAASRDIRTPALKEDQNLSLAP
jgi:hypothetical protein